jgi:prephenate dehydratase
MAKKVNNTKIAVLGPEGTFTEQAALKYQNETREKAKLVFLSRINLIFEAVKRNKADKGILPLENMIDGSLGEVLDLLYHSNLKIIEEIVVPIHHCLASLPETSINRIKVVMSHPKALTQCSNFLRKKNYELKETLSTAEAMREIKESRIKDAAAIGPELAARKYSLKVLAKNIEDNKGNVTRFIVISKKSARKEKGKKYKTSIAIHPSKDRPGLLHDLLGKFAFNNINLTKIESRPTKFRLGEYVFYIDLEGHAQDKKVISAFKEIRKLAEVKIFGSYVKKY